MIFKNGLPHARRDATPSFCPGAFGRCGSAHDPPSLDMDVTPADPFGLGIPGHSSLAAVRPRRQSRAVTSDRTKKQRPGPTRQRWSGPGDRAHGEWGQPRARLFEGCWVRLADGKDLTPGLSHQYVVETPELSRVSRGVPQPSRSAPCPATASD